MFTPYRNAWLRTLTPSTSHRSRVDAHMPALVAAPPELALPSPTLGDARIPPHQPGRARRAHRHGGGAALFADSARRIDDYRDARDYPAVKGPSYLSVHLRFGTVSIRELAAYAHARALEPGGAGAATWLVRARLARLLRADPVAPPARRRTTLSGRSTRRSPFPTTTPGSRRGARRAPAIRSSTPRCASSTRLATCTTVCA